MSNDQRALTVTTTTRTNSLSDDQYDIVESPVLRDIHALTPPRAARWESAGNQRSSSLSVGGSGSSSTTSEDFTTMSREFSALVLAGHSIRPEPASGSGSRNLGRIREEDHVSNLHELLETNPLAIVADNSRLDPVQSPVREDNRLMIVGGSSSGGGGGGGEVTVERVKKEEVDTKIGAWQNAKVAKINNRFKREDAVINGWEGEQVQKATSRMKKVERKLEEKRAKALEKMQNDVAKAHRKAEERRASAEAKRGTKVARILEIANLMRAVGRPPVKRSFF